MKRLIVVALTATALLAGSASEPTQTYLNAISIDPNDVVTMRKVAISQLYEAEIRSRVAAQIAEAIAALPTGTDPVAVQALIDASVAPAIAASEQRQATAITQARQQMQQLMVDADKANLALMKSQTATAIRDILNTYLSTLGQ